MKRLLIKIGSNVLTLSTGLPDVQRIEHIVLQVAELKKQGYQLILVSSGAVAAGKSVLKKGMNKAIINPQVLAAVGQVQLIGIYNDFFQKQRLLCSQVMVTKDDFRTRQHYLNMRNCLEALLASDVVPIINENDTISITDLMFSDNDELSGLVAVMMDVESLLMLSDVDGIFTKHPSEPDAVLIPEYIPAEVNLDEHLAKTKSETGRGGMKSKAKTAMKIAALGVDVYIGNGETDQVISKLLKRETGTYFPAQKNRPSHVKKWVAQSESFSKGSIVINPGAKEALFSKEATSLLPVGVTQIRGNFQKGDVVTILDESEKAIGLGKVAYNSEKATACIGLRDTPALVHYDYLFLY